MIYNLWKLSYWLNFRPEPLSKLSLSLLTIAGLLAIGAYVFSFKISQKPNLGSYRKLIERLKTFSLTNGIIALLLAFFSWQMIPLFAARFWLLLWLIIVLVWKLCLWLDFRQLQRKINSADRSKFVRDQYLPKKS